MPHFFISSKSLNHNKINILDENNIFHIAITLRCKVNEIIKLVDENHVVYEVNIDNISKKIIETTVLKSYKSKRISPYNISLAQGVLNSDDEYDVIKMATELGISTIYPILTDNSSVKKDIVLKKISKFEKIAYEAAKQCERANIPNIIAKRTLDDLVCDKSFDKVFIFSEIEEKYTLKDYFKEIFELFANCLMILTLALSAHLLLSNVYHYIEVNKSYNYNLNESKTYISFKENVKEIELLVISQGGKLIKMNPRIFSS